MTFLEAMKAVIEQGKRIEHPFVSSSFIEYRLSGEEKYVAIVLQDGSSTPMVMNDLMIDHEQYKLVDEEKNMTTETPKENLYNPGTDTTIPGYNDGNCKTCIKQGQNDCNKCIGKDTTLIADNPVVID